MIALLRDWSLVVGPPVLLRLCLTGTFPLCEDEAYYWEWSRNLALGYHDQGPGVALAIRLGTALFGESEFDVRFPAVLLLGGALSFADRHLRDGGAVLRSRGTPGPHSRGGAGGRRRGAVAMMGNEVEIEQVDQKMSGQGAPEIAVALEDGAEG